MEKKKGLVVGWKMIRTDTLAVKLREGIGKMWELGTDALGSNRREAVGTWVATQIGAEALGSKRREAVVGMRVTA